MDNGIQTTDTRDLATVAESLVTKGDLSALTPAERARHYIRTCEHLGLNANAQPFSFLLLNGKLVMYANRGATDQLASMNRVNREIIDGPKVIDLGGMKVVYCVARASLPNGRTETAIATVPMVDPVNVLMKAETKAKRRVTLSILGLGVLDETETDTIPGAVRVESPRLDLHSAAPQLAPAPALPPCDAADLAGVARWYAALALGADDSERAEEASGAAGDHLSALGYHLSSVEHGAALRGALASDVATLHDALALAADSDAVVRVARAFGGLGAPDAHRTVLSRYYAARSGLKGAAAAKALRAALTPPQPPPTGTDAPPVATPADAHGTAAATATGDGAQASVRLVLDADEAEARLLRADATGDAAWSEHLAAHAAVFAMAGAHAKRLEAFRAAGVLEARRRQTLAAIEAREGRGPEAALQALDGYRTRRVIPLGASVRARTHAEIAASRAMRATG